MASHKITIDGREYPSPEAMPPGVRRVYDQVLRKVDSALDEAGGAGSAPGLKIENQIIVNRQAYGSPDEKPPDVRRLYEEAMGRMRRGAGVSTTRKGLSLSIGLSWGDRPPPTSAPGTPPAMEPSATESYFRTALVVLALVVVGGLAIVALAGR